MTTQLDPESIPMDDWLRLSDAEQWRIVQAYLPEGHDTRSRQFAPAPRRQVVTDRKREQVRLSMRRLREKRRAT